MRYRQVQLAVALLILLVGGHTAAADAADRVARWAPAVYFHDQSANIAAQENVFTTVNYDLDWRANNNWANLPYYPPQMAAYYSVVESETHWFLGYYLYYPRYVDGRETEHDMVGILAAVRKNPDGSEALDALFTYARKQWRGRDGKDVRLDAGHPAVFVGAGSHAVRAVGATDSAPRGPVLFPLPPGMAANAVGKRIEHRWAYPGYRLVALGELWERRNDIGKGRVFSRWGYFDSEYPGTPKAAPWLWECRRFRWLAEPAELLQSFRRAPARQVRYLYNPYRNEGGSGRSGEERGDEERPGGYP